jgi:hypothetical protein
MPRSTAAAAAVWSALTVLLLLTRAEGFAQQLMRKGTEIVVCGQFYDLETPVVSWMGEPNAAFASACACSLLLQTPAALTTIARSAALRLL